MFDFWSQELTVEETDQLLDKVVTEIKKRKLELPFSMVVEMHLPLANVLGQASVGLAPFLVPVLGFDMVNNYSRLFSKRENMEALLDRLERQDTVLEEVEV